VAIGKDGAGGRQLRTLFNVGAIRELSDGQLLERFAAGRGEAAELAFAALVERHGPMVLRVCRGVLDDPHESQDAFQATFLVLVTKVRALWVRDSLGPWLHQVAYRTASCARATSARRRRLERRAAVREESGRTEVVDDLGRVLHEEIDRLPERYRAPVVLCDLEGRTHEQAARHLGWPVGTVKSRQARARERLRGRLVRRGFAPGVGLLVPSTGLAAPLPLALVDSTTVAASRFIASRAIAPGPAAWLAREVIRSMMMLRFWKAAAVLLALGAAGSGVGLLAQDRKPGDGLKPEEKAQAARPDDVPAVAVKPGKLIVTVSERGSVEAARTKDVICEVEGTTTIIKILPEGSQVKEGEVVAELDSASLHDQVINQRIATLQAEATYKQAQIGREVAELASKEYLEGVYPSGRETLQGKINQAQAAIQKGQARLERTRRARKEMDAAKVQRAGPPTPPDIAAELEIDDHLDDAELNLSQQKLNLELVQSEQALLQKYTSPKTTKQLANEIERAKSDELRKLSIMQLENTKGRKLERQIERCTLRAPGDGLIVYANNPTRQGQLQIEEGATVRERQLIFRVVDPNGPMRVNTKVQEAVVDRLRPGLTARIRVDAFADQELIGTVNAVAPLPDPTTRFSNDRKVYTTFVQIEKGFPSLRPGMTARVEILVTEVDNVLSVPIASVVQFNDKDHVAVKTPEGAIEWREVGLGLSNDKHVEVKKGLRPGDLVVLDPIAQMSEAMRRKLLTRPTPPANAPGSPR
jgi:HlyD family secretion protein